MIFLPLFLHSYPAEMVHIVEHRYLPAPLTPEQVVAKRAADARRAAEESWREDDRIRTADGEYDLGDGRVMTVTSSGYEIHDR